ncbi:hypothetical protein ACIBAH_35595 [Streptomyces sp. NPDC051445]|uniref:hypothetical protein n=1 Tax=Streptomyces sp. NPDC051445 TaxID=3365653 RepID=UPI0037A415CF
MVDILVQGLMNQLPTALITSLIALAISRSKSTSHPQDDESPRARNDDNELS